MEIKNKKLSPYKNLILMIALSFFVMYGVMFLNVFEIDHIYTSTNRFYMALLMVCPMVLVMMGMMRSMYPNRKQNAIIVLCAVVVFILAFAGLRTQTLIGDREYMKAMIPHHSSAVMTSTHAHLRDPAVRRLADSIIVSQQREIAEMKLLLQQLEQGRPLKIAVQPAKHK